MKYSCIITAAGSGSRFDVHQKKQFCLLNNQPLLFYSLNFFYEIEEINEIIISLPNDDFGTIQSFLGSKYPSKVKSVLGGNTRQQSVYHAIQACSHSDYVIIHDGVRPFINRMELFEMMGLVQDHNGIILGAKVTNTIKRINAEQIQSTLDRSHLIEVYTPQIFKYEILFKCHQEASKLEQVFTDDAGILEYFQIPLLWYETKDHNLKITTKNDLSLAEIILQSKG